jgi:hypothetical protein
LRRPSFRIHGLHHAGHIKPDAEEGLDLDALGCDDSGVHGIVSGFVFMGAALVALGVFGYFNERRRRGADGVRRFLIWYCFVWPFMACGMCAIAFPRLHWLYYVEFGIAGLGYGVQALDWRRAKARAAARGSVGDPSR